MDNTVQTAPREVLLSIAFIEALAEAVRRLELSRRRLPNWLADVLFAHAESGGAILNWKGEPICIHDELVDIAHGSDGCMTCMSDLMATYPGTRRTPGRSTMLLRLGLYDAAFKIIGQPVVVGD